jgi:hypothetical protein
MASTQSVVSARIQAESQTKVTSTLRMFSMGENAASVLNFGVTSQYVSHVQFVQGPLHLAECLFEEGRMGEAASSIDA